MDPSISLVVVNNNGNSDEHTNQYAHKRKASYACIPPAALLEYNWESGKAQVKRAVHDGRIELFLNVSFAIYDWSTKTYRENEDDWFPEK